MNDCTIMGFAIGLLAGALIVTNSKKAQDIVEKGKKAVKQQIEKMK